MGLSVNSRLVKIASIPALENEFYQGNYRGVLSLSVDSRISRIESESLGWIVGALSFVGRLDEAEALFLSKSRSRSRREIVQARFFLGIGFSRQSKYERARHYFGLNLRKKNTILDPELTFFIYQGLSFYRYFTGRFDAAFWASTRAYTASMSGGYLYGKVL